MSAISIILNNLNLSTRAVWGIGVRKKVLSYYTSVFKGSLPLVRVVANLAAVITEDTEHRPLTFVPINQRLDIAHRRVKKIGLYS